MIEEEIEVATDFSGLGSFEEALKRLQVKHKIVFACDKDKYVKASYLANHKPDIFFDDIVQRNQNKAPYSDIYVFGFPCQAFSIAGNRKGFEDTRGTLVYNSVEYIDLKRPRAFIFENVKGLLSHDKVKGSKSKYGRTFGVIRDILATTVNGQQNLYKYEDCLNYHCYFQVLNSKEYGIPQNRERVFMVGFRDEEDALKFKFHKKFDLQFKLKDFLQKEEEVDQKYYLSDTALKRLIKTPNFLPQCNPEITCTINTKNNSGQLSRDNGTTLIVTNNHGQLMQQDIFNCIDANYQKGMDNHGQRSLLMINEANKDGFAIAEAYDTINYSNAKSKTRRGRIGKQIANTLDIDCKQVVLIPSFETNSNSDLKVRRLTPKEVFRLFGYSDEFFEMCKALNSDTQLYKQAGNSIVVDTVMWVLVSLCKALNVRFVSPEIK